MNKVEKIQEIINDIIEEACSEDGTTVGHIKIAALEVLEIASLDEVKPDDLLLTDEEIKEVVASYSVELMKSNPILEWNQTEVIRRNIQAQLSKAEPLIRADERKKIGEWLDEHTYLNDYGHLALDKDAGGGDFIANLKSGKPVKE